MPSDHVLTSPAYAAGMREGMLNPGTTHAPLIERATELTWLYLHERGLTDRAADDVDLRAAVTDFYRGYRDGVARRSAGQSVIRAIIGETEGEESIGKTIMTSLRTLHVH